MVDKIMIIGRFQLGAFDIWLNLKHVYKEGTHVICVVGRN